MAAMRKTRRIPQSKWDEQFDSCLKKRQDTLNAWDRLLAAGCSEILLRLWLYWYAEGIGFLDLRPWLKEWNQPPKKLRRLAEQSEWLANEIQALNQHPHNSLTQIVRYLAANHVPKMAGYLEEVARTVESAPSQLRQLAIFLRVWPGRFVKALSGSPHYVPALLVTVLDSYIKRVTQKHCYGELAQLLECAKPSKKEVDADAVERRCRRFREKHPAFAEEIVEHFFSGQHKLDANTNFRRGNK